MPINLFGGAGHYLTDWLKTKSIVKIVIAIKENKMENYEKKYKEALKAASIAYKNEDRVLKATLKRIFPELVESKDEKTRKEIISTIHLYYGEPLEDEAKEMIAWIEKQGEQKPAWSEEDEIRLKHILRLLDVGDGKKYLLAFGLNSLQDLEKDIVWLKSLKDRIGG